MTETRHSPFKVIDKMVDAFLSMQIFLKIITVMTIIVTPVALYHMFKPAISPIFSGVLPSFDHLLLIGHIGFSLPATVFGPFLLHAGFRKLKPHWHRAMGKIYVVGCIGGAITVFPLAVNNGAGPIAQFGFGSMAVIWFFVTYFAYTAAINNDYVAHRRWIMRSYAMTFAFVHVNLTYRLVLPYELMSTEAIKVMQSMVSWQMNWFLVEIYLALTSPAGKFMKPQLIWQRLQFWSSQDKIIWPLKPLQKR